MRAAFLPSLATAITIAACGETPTKVRIVDEVSPDGSYATRDAEILTLTDLRAVRGEALELFGGAALDVAEAAALDRGGSRQAVVAGAGELHARWITQGDVAVPLDVDSLAALSAYFHFEAAAQLFADLGVTTAGETLTVYFEPEILDTSGTFPTNDNAFYWPEIDAFVLLPNVVLQEIPFAMNPGVLTHELSHRVWYFEAWGGAMFERLSFPGATSQTWNLIRSADEGVADFYAAHLTDNPAFLGPSIDPELVEPRDLTVLGEVDAQWLTGERPVVDGVYDWYALGSVTASTLWAFAEISGRQAVASAILEAARVLSIRWAVQVSYAVGDLEAEVIAQLPAEDRVALCDRAALSHAAAWTALAAVCP